MAESSVTEDLSDDNERYYELLGVARDAVPRDVQMAYRLRALGVVMNLEQQEPESAALALTRLKQGVGKE